MRVMYMGCAGSIGTILVFVITFAASGKVFPAFVAAGIWIVFLILLNNYFVGKQFKEKAKSEGALEMLPLIHFEGLPIEKNAHCGFYNFDDHIKINTTPRQFIIKHDRIRAAVVKTEHELIQIEKDVIGRALIGNLLVPGIGAIVGGMSGIGTKTVKGKLNHFFIINYLSVEGNLEAVTFVNNDNFIRLQNLANKLNLIYRPLDDDEEPIVTEL